MNTYTSRPAAWVLISLSCFAFAPAQALDFVPVAGGPDSASVAFIDADTDGTLYTAAGSQVVASSDDGATWTATSAGTLVGLSQVVADGGNLFIKTAQGVMKSSDGGASFTGFNGAGEGALPNIDRISFSTFEVAGGFVYVASRDPERSYHTFIYRSPVGSPDWTDVTPAGLTSFSSLISAGSNLCLLARNNGVQFSSDNGDTWARAANTSGNFSFIGKSADGANVYIAAGTLRRSTNQCAAFTQVAGNGLTPEGSFNRDVFSLGVDSAGNVYAGGNTGTLRVSSDNGANFTVDNDGDLANDTGVSIRALTASATGMVVGTSGGGIFSNSGGAWARASGPRASSVNALADAGAAGAIDIGVSGGGYFRTNDGGATITQGAQPGLRGTRALYRNGSTLLVGTDALRGNGLTVTGLFRSTDGGASFDSVSGLPDGAGVSVLVSDGTAIFANVNDAADFTQRGVYKSTDGGATWSNTTTNLPTTQANGVPNLTGNGLAARPGSVFAYVANGSVYRSDDGGATWSQKSNGLAGSSFGGVFATANTLIATAGGVVYRSTDNGENWQATTGFAVSEFGINLLSMADDPAGVVYVGDEHAGLSVSSDGGATWTPDSDGLAPSGSCIGRISALLVNNGKVYAGNGAGGGLFISDVLGSGAAGDSVDCTTSGGDEQDRTPDAFAFLDQTGVPQNTPITSTIVTIQGISDGTPISIDVGEYAIGCSTTGNNTFTSAPGTIDNSQAVCVRHTSANAPNTAVNSVLTVGTGSDTFTTTTAEDAGGTDTTPELFTFVDQTGVAQDTVIESNTITVIGIDAPADVTVTGGSYAIGCAANGFTSDAGSVNNGDTVCVRHTSASTASTPVDTTLSIGGVSDTFTSTTGDDPAAGDTQTVSDPAGKTVTFTSNAGSIENLANEPNPPAGTPPPAGVTFANGYFSFDITGLNNGDSVDVTITLPAGSTPDTYYKFHNGGSFEFLRGATDNEGAVISGNMITLTLVDGGLGDADGVANGGISDPGAPGTTMAGGNGGDGSTNFSGLGSGGCVMAASTGRVDPSFGLLLLLALMGLFGQRRRVAGSKQ